MATTVQAKYTIAEANERLRHLLDKNGEVPLTSVNELYKANYVCHLIAISRGWWHEKDGVKPRDRNIGELIALVHSELSEALEGVRSDKRSDHIDSFSMFEEEMADVFIRLGDLCQATGVSLPETVRAKLNFNLRRKDHSVEARHAEGGKKF